MFRQFLGVLITIIIALQLFAPAIVVHAEDTVFSQENITPDSSTDTTKEASDNANKEDKPPIPVTPTSISVGTYLKAPGQNISNNIGDFIIRAINFLAMVIGSFALLVIIIGGFILLGSGGSESVVQKGKDTIKYAVIGLAIALSAFYITAFVQSIFFENV